MSKVVAHMSERKKESERISIEQLTVASIFEMVQVSARIRLEPKF